MEVGESPVLVEVRDGLLGFSFSVSRIISSSNFSFSGEDDSM